MRLRLVRTEPSSGDATWNIETPTPGVVLIDVTIDAREASSPLHWRGGMWSKPPLDLMLDGRGRLLGFQFVLQDEQVATRQGRVLPDPEVGLPVFDIDGWPSDRFCDETLPVKAMRLGNNQLALRLGENQPLARSLTVASRVVMGFTDAGALAEIRLGPLDPEDWAAISAFSYVE